VIDCAKETDTAKQLILCKDAKQVNASAFGCAQNKDDNVCDNVTVRAQGGTTYKDKEGADGFNFDAAKQSAECCDGKATKDCNNLISCHKGMVDAGTVTGDGGYMKDITGAAAPATTLCAVGDDRCLAIIVDCSKETDADQKLVLCKTADTTQAEYYSCAKNADDGWCKDDTFDVPAAAKDKTGIEGFKATESVQLCCKGQDVANCNQVRSCIIGGKDTGSSTADGKSMNTLTKVGRTPATGKCALGQTQCARVVITCDKETVEAQRLVFCTKADTKNA